jgi:predicted RNA methylase
MDEQSVEKLLKLLKKKEKISYQIQKELLALSVDNLNDLSIFLYEYYRNTDNPKTWNDITAFTGVSRQAANQHKNKNKIHPSVVFSDGSDQAKSKWAFFETPENIVTSTLNLPIFELINEGDEILEPSAGQGMLASGIRKRFSDIDISIDCCEIVPSFCQVLQSKGFKIVGTDFLTYNPDKRYKAVVMNPPFTLSNDRHTYIKHILHAWELLSGNGFLISFAPRGLIIRTDKETSNFLNFCTTFGTVEELPSRSFRESGTDSVITRVVLKK